MRKTTITRKSLLFSGFALLLSALLLAGTTFAWFTDTVTNEGNTIQAGTFDVRFSGNRYDGGNWKAIHNLNRDSLIHEENWEPGQWNAVVINVSNFHNDFSAKVDVSFTITEGNEQGGLAEALWYKLTPFVSNQATAERAGAENRLTFVKADSRPATGDTRVKPMTEIGKEKNELTLGTDGEIYGYYLLEYGMYTDADNEYQGKTFGLEFAVKATQATGEADGFGNTDYDKDAYMADFTAGTDEELTSALEKAEAGDVIALSEGEFQLPAGEIPEGVTIRGSGIDKTFITVPETQSGSNTMGLVINQPGVTLSNATFKPNEKISNWNYAGVIVVKEGDTVLDNIKVTSNNGASPILVTDRSFGEGDTLTISNSIIASNARSVYLVDGTNGKVVIDHCEITGVYPFNVNSDSSQNLEIEVKDSKLHGWTSYGYIKSASFTNTEFSQGDSDYNFLRPYADTTWTNCTFGEGFLIGGGASGKTYTFNNCQYADGTDVTAENSKERLLYSEDTPLTQCTITVDGVSVTFN